MQDALHQQKEMEEEQEKKNRALDDGERERQLLQDRVNKSNEEVSRIQSQVASLQKEEVVLKEEVKNGLKE